jgi:hypothetical protein
MRNRPKPNGRRLKFEPLETRALLAGNVTASVTAGELDITGHAAGNAIQVWQTGPTTWKVQGIATTVNGSHNTFIATGITGDIDANLPDANSFIRVFNGVVPGSLKIDVGRNNTVSINKVTTGASLDVSTVENSVTITVSNAVVGGDLGIDTGNGVNAVSVNAVAVTEDVNIDTGNNKNVVAIVNADVSEDINLSGGNGLQVFSIRKVSVEADINIATEVGSHVFTVANANVVEDLNISTGDGPTTINVNTVVIGEDINIDTGNEPATIAVVNAQLGEAVNISDGSGNDIVSLANVTAPDGLDITTGGGTDAVSLYNVNVGSSEMKVDVGPGNYDSLAVVNCTAGTEEFSDTGGTNGTIVGALNDFATPPAVTGFSHKIGI